MKIFKRLLSLLSPTEIKNLYILISILIFTALADIIGIASILPFMAVLTNPGLIETNLALNKIFEFSKIFGVENNQDFFFVLGLIILFILIFTLILKATATFLQIRFVQLREYSIGKLLVQSYLRQPYSWFLDKHSADLGKTILSEAHQITLNGIRSIIEFIAKGISAAAIIILLIVVDPKIAIIVGVSIGGAYFVIFFFVRKILSKVGKKRLKNNEIRFLTLAEAFGSLKEIKVGGLENIYINRFSDASKNYALSQTYSLAIGQLPRFFLEAIAFGGILLLLIYMISKSGNLSSALPMISLYVVAGYRLMPSLQLIYYSISNLAFINPAIDKMYEDIKNLDKNRIEQDTEILQFNNYIDLKNISYSYPNSDELTLKNINIHIPIKSKVGIVGMTGSGKTTVVDILIGLLEAQNGTIEIDGQILSNKNLRAWQRYIGYVPQRIYLSDTTIAANIAIGEEYNKINYKTVEKVSKIANLHEFVKNELPQQYQTVIGENGARLSGGQRQRIGIARALYFNPKVLIFDEATSALDNNTEDAVLHSINNLGENITTIFITHRLSTLKKCDIIYKIEKGQLIAKGSFDEFNNDIEQN